MCLTFSNREPAQLSTAETKDTQTDEQRDEQLHEMRVANELY